MHGGPDIAILCAVEKPGASDNRYELLTGKSRASSGLSRETILERHLNYARRRVREEADAAATATYLAATLTLVDLAIAYAKRSRGQAFLLQKFYRSIAIC